MEHALLGRFILIGCGVRRDPFYNSHESIRARHIAKILRGLVQTDWEQKEFNLRRMEKLNSYKK